MKRAKKRPNYEDHTKTRKDVWDKQNCKDHTKTEENTENDLSSNVKKTNKTMEIIQKLQKMQKTIQTAIQKLIAAHKKS